MSSAPTNTPHSAQSTHIPFVVPGYDAVRFSFPPYTMTHFGAPLAERTIDYKERPYLLRCLYLDRVLFRPLTGNLPEWTYFLYTRLNAADLAVLPPRQFAQMLDAKQYGRCVGCKPGGKYDRNIFYLMLRVDGTGSCYNCSDALDFTWDWKQAGLSAPEEILTFDLVELDLYTCRQFARHCEAIINAQIAKRLKNYYVDPGDLQDAPFTFHCGSQAELEEVIRWACWTEPDLFAASQAQCITYYSATERRHAYSEQTSAQPRSLVAMSKRLKTLCRLAYRHNTFTGWTYHKRKAVPRRRRDYLLVRAQIPVAVQAPSAHERAEALYRLSEWLDGKVAAKRKARLLGLA